MKIKDRPEFKSKPKPFTMRGEEMISGAIKVMAEKNIGSVVIVDDAQHIKGIVTERDFLRRLLDTALDPQITPLSSIMTTEVKTAQVDDKVVDWIRQMSNERFRHLPVVDDDGRLINVFSQGDFVSYTWPELLTQFTAKTKETFSMGRFQLPMMIFGILLYTVVILIVVRGA